MDKLRESPDKAEVSIAVPEDVYGMQDVFYQGWIENYPNEEYVITVEDIEDRWKDRYSAERLAKRREQILNPAPGFTTLVAKVGEHVAGVCTVVKYEDKNVLKAIYVLPIFQGEGLGKRLWQEARRYTDPTLPTYVEVVVYNEQAIGFYKKLGFKDTGKRIKDPRFTLKSGAILPEFEMRREPAPAL